MAVVGGRAPAVHAAPLRLGCGPREAQLGAQEVLLVVPGDVVQAGDAHRAHDGRLVACVRLDDEVLLVLDQVVTRVPGTHATS